MKLLSRMIFVTVGCVSLITAAGVLTPRAVHAQDDQGNRVIIRDQDNPARHPFAASCVGTSTTQFVSCIMTVPAGQRVVIETAVSRTAASPGNTVMEFAVQTTAAGTTNLYNLAVLQDSGLFQPGEAAFYGGAQSVHLYADPSTSIICQGITHGANPSPALGMTCTISGYYVTLP